MKKLSRLELAKAIENAINGVAEKKLGKTNIITVLTGVPTSIPY